MKSYNESDKILHGGVCGAKQCRVKERRSEWSTWQKEGASSVTKPDTGRPSAPT
jgi:hypothetical protein